MANTGILSVGSFQVPIVKQEYNDNFSNVVPLTQRVVGMDGGFDLDGDDPSPNQIGRVTFGFWLISSTRAGMDALRDDVRKLPTLGRQLIVYQPTEPTDLTRYIYGKVNAVNMQQQVAMHTDLWQRVQIILQCPEPVWKSSAGWDWSPADGSEIADGSYVLDSGAGTSSITSTPATIAITNDGTAIAYPTLVLRSTGTKTLGGWKLQRIVDGLVADEVSYDGIISSSAELTVDASRKLVHWQGKRAWGSKLTYKHADLFRFFPGSNSIRVTGDIDGAGTDPELIWWLEDTWR